MAGLNHDFLLVDREIDGEWGLLKFINDPRAIHLHDDFMRYISDTLQWIPSFNPSTKVLDYGLYMWGPSLITTQGAPIAHQVFSSWANLFSKGPKTLKLKGSYCFSNDEHELTDAPLDIKMTAIQGGYEQLEYDRDQIVDALCKIADWCLKVQNGNGRFYLYHDGV